MPEFYGGKVKKAKAVRAKLRKPLPYRRGAAEEEHERVKIPRTKGGEPPRQNDPTKKSDVTGPGEQREIVFQTYTPLDKPKNPGLFGLAPPDMSGADSPLSLVLYTGNTYLSASKDAGASFVDLDSTTFLPAIPGRAVDQVIIYIPRLEGYAWMMQHGQSAGTNDGNFRLAFALAKDLKSDFQKPWKSFDFKSSDFGFKGVATDRQDLSYTERFLYLTTTFVGKGRVIIRIPLDDLKTNTVSTQVSAPLEGIFAFSDLSQQNSTDVHMAGLIDDKSLRVVTFHDGTGTYDFHDVSVGKFPVADDLSSVDPDGVDWLTLGVANVSAALSHGDDLWIAWDAAASQPGDKPFYPNAHVRIAQINVTTWKAVSERQVWNKNFAFAYGTLAVNGAGDIGYGVAVGGKADFPNACFGILGDFVVYFRNSSDITALGGATARWGDYITARPSLISRDKFSAFGYFTKKTSGGGSFQTPYYLQYGRP